MAAERTTLYKQIVLLAAAQLMLTGPAWAQQNPVQWGEATAAKMAHFLPEPAAGFVSRTPWGRQTDNQVVVRSGGTVTLQYQDAAAEQLFSSTILRCSSKWQQPKKKAPIWIKPTGKT